MYYYGEEVYIIDNGRVVFVHESREIKREQIKILNDETNKYP